jgi:hypothetical protein
MAGHAIFIGYRREDTRDVAGRIYDALVRRFGKPRIFKDVANLRPGADFGAYIQDVLPRCRVFLALIGPAWLQARDEAGARRLDDPHDWVRIEIETALATPGLDVVPVLINGARMPKADELPEGLRPLLRRHAASIRPDPDFHDDVARLAHALKDSVRTGVLDLAGLRAGEVRSGAGASAPGGVKAARSSAARAPAPWALMVALVGVLAAGGGWWLLHGAGTPTSQPAAAEPVVEALAGEGAPAPPAFEPDNRAQTIAAIRGRWAYAGACFTYAINGDALRITGPDWDARAQVGAYEEDALLVTGESPAEVAGRFYRYSVQD